MCAFHFPHENKVLKMHWMGWGVGGGGNGGRLEGYLFLTLMMSRHLVGGIKEKGEKQQRGDDIHLRHQ